VPGFAHHSADLSGIAPARLRDPAFLGGLLIAAAGAAGLSASSAPVVRTRGNQGMSAFLLLEAEGCHLSAHSTPDDGLVLLDVLVPATREAEKAVEVFVRRLEAAKVERRTVLRGASGDASPAPTPRR
jgi:S-adenosylmethionine decarboxylase